MGDSGEIISGDEGGLGNVNCECTFSGDSVLSKGMEGESSSELSIEMGLLMRKVGGLGG